MDIVAILIGLAAIFGTIPVFYVAWLYRNDKVVPVGKRAFWAMGLGLIAIGIFYFGVAMDVGNVAMRILCSRFLWLFIILSSVGMAGGVMFYRRGVRLWYIKEENGVIKNG